jgi:hypothetical protein
MTLPRSSHLERGWLQLIGRRKGRKRWVRVLELAGRNHFKQAEREHGVKIYLKRGEEERTPGALLKWSVVESECETNGSRFLYSTIKVSHILVPRDGVLVLQMRRTVWDTNGGMYS